MISTRLYTIARPGIQLRTGSICSRCLQRRHSSSSILPNSGAVKLTSSRRLIAIHGKDAPKFLNGATTNNVPNPGASDVSSSGFYSAFLTAQGRILYDVFIYPTTHSSKFHELSLSAKADKSDPGYLIECDAESTTSLMEHIDRYKLRSKFTFRVVDGGEWDVWSAWDENNSNNSKNNRILAPIDEGKGEIGCLDKRAPGMGKRLVLPNRNTPSSFFGGVEEEVPDNTDTDLTDIYKIRRMLAGVPEGQSELVSGTALPLESNMDIMGGVDFRKGCYVGQELTIRTRHTGVVRKRVLPVQLYPMDQTLEEAEKPKYDPSTREGGLGKEGLSLPPPQTNISRVGKKGRNVGKFYGGIGNIGLALCRLEIMTDASLHGGEEEGFHQADEFKVEWGGGGEDGKMSPNALKIKAFLPRWHKEQAV